MDENAAISRILEVENLTDELEDDEANLLIDWASKHVGTLIAGLPDEDAAGEKVGDLMDVMRKINRLTALRKQRTPEQIQAELGTFNESVAKAFGTAPTLAPQAANAQPLGAALKAQSDQEFVQTLIGLAESALKLSPAPSKPDNTLKEDAEASATPDEDNPTISL